MSDKKSPRILIVRLSAIGDAVHTLPVLASLRKKFPDAFISWVVEDKAADVVVNNPMLDKVYVLPKKKWKKEKNRFNAYKEFWKIIGQIRKDKYDIAIDVQELLKSGVISFLSGANRRICHSKSREHSYLFANELLPAHDTFDPDKKVIDRYLEAAAHLGADVSDVEFPLPPVSESTSIYIDELLKNIDKSKPTVVFSPATTWASKHWVESYWAELLDMLADKCNIVFTGAPNDETLIKRITSMSKTDKYISLAGKTNLLELAEVFRRVDMVIAPDTGPAHIANAVGKPVVVAIFSSMSHKRTGVYGEKHVNVSASLECQPCKSKVCKREDHVMECMKLLTPEVMFKIIEEKLTSLS